MKIVLFAVLLVATSSAEDEYAAKWARFWQKVAEDPELSVTHDRWMKEFGRDDGLGPLYPEFKCDTSIGKSAKKPTSVHELRPGDIQVIGAVGDSITAGFGLDASGDGSLSTETRGESWAVGGNADIDSVLTISNVIKEFNGDLFGASLNNPGATCRLGAACSYLNRAVSGAINTGIPGQMQSFIEKVEEYAEDGLIDMENDWKLVTIFIGGNDLCRHCNNPGGNTSPQQYFESIQAAVENVRTSVPRVMVNLVIMFDVTPLDDMSTSDDYTAFCRTAHATACGCAINPDDEDLIRDVQYKYWELLEKWINEDGTYDEYDDFTVVIQPHMRDQGAPYLDDGTFDLSFFAPDCFHPNRKGHQIMALALWNAMMTPVQEKPCESDLDPDAELEFTCPTEERPYIFTRGNSDLPATGYFPSSYCVEPEI